MKQFVITPAMGKRLIGKGMAAHPAIVEVLAGGTLVIVAGSTNAYVAQEVLAATGQAAGFSPLGFRRGVVVPPKNATPPLAEGDLPGQKAGPFPGDVVLMDGKWDPGKTIFDVADGLKAGDVILKGANAVDLRGRQAAVLIGHPQAGTAGAAIAAATGRRVRLIVPVGVEKRVDEPVADLAALVNSPDSQGPGMLPLPGQVFTELDAIALLTGATATLLAAGGVHGAEGAAWVGVAGEPDQVEAAAELIDSVADEPPCRT